MDAHISSTVDIPRELKNRVRKLYHSGDLPKELILKRLPHLSEQQFNAIISEPDGLEDFRLEKFSDLTRNLYQAAQMTLDSISEMDLKESSIASRATLLKNTLDVMRRTYDLQQVLLSQSDDMALARLLAMGREEARDQLIERFRKLSFVLFGGMAPEEVMKELSLLPSTSSQHSGGRSLTYAGEEAEIDGVDGSASAEPGSVSSPNLKLVSDDTKLESNSSDSSRGGAASQGIGAFRGVKEGKPS